MPTASTDVPLGTPDGAGERCARRRCAAGFLLFLASLLQAPVPGLSGSPSDDPAQVARGAQVYAEACATCHGTALEGQADWRSPQPDGTYPAPPHDAEGHTWHHADSLLFRYTRLGGAEALKDVPGFRSGMPGFSETLSDRDIWDVLAYIKSHWPEQMREYQRAVTENDK